MNNRELAQLAKDVQEIKCMLQALAVALGHPAVSDPPTLQGYYGYGMADGTARGYVDAEGVWRFLTSVTII